VVGRRLLLLDVMPGHGRDNLLHELELGNAGVSGPAAADLVAGALAMLAAGGGEVPRAPRWEPAFAAALRRIGFEAEPDGRQHADPVPEPA
jgi:processive 1,2-diacylglycerol beta-glucosyltransferase